MAGKAKITVGVVLFEGFEPLDVVGPVNIFGSVPGIQFIYIAEQQGPVASITGAMTLLASHRFKDMLPDITCETSSNPATAGPGQQQQQHTLTWLLVPGGIGTRKEVNNPALLEFIRAWGQQSSGLQLCMSVCTGAVLLATAGVLDGLRATTNKIAFEWVKSARPAVRWEREARWVHDGNFVTASGVSAGMDAAVYVLKTLLGSDIASAAAKRNEYLPNIKADEDPFADSGFTPDV